MFKFSITYCILILLSAGCQQSITVNNLQTFDFGAFTLEAPRLWKKLETIGIDSFVGAIVTNHNDTINFDLGPYSNPLTEREPVIIENDDSALYKNYDVNEIVVLEDIRMVKDIDQYKRQNLRWDSIDGYEVKIVYPRKAGKGKTGVYIDSLWKSKNGVERFNLYATDLDINTQLLFLEAIKTIKFRRPV